jgi:hypothetical protein
MQGYKKQETLMEDNYKPPNEFFSSWERRFGKVSEGKGWWEAATRKK